jgi:hypothetical protein
MEEIEPAVRPDLALIVVEGLVVVGGLAPPDILCLELGAVGAFLVLSDKEARGLADAEAFVAVLEPDGETTDWRGPAAVGLAGADDTGFATEDRDDLVVGMTDALRVVAVVSEGLVDAAVGLVGEAADVLVDFLREEVADTTAFTTEVPVDFALVIGADFVVPVPNVPELMILNTSQIIDSRQSVWNSHFFH